jgi:hypothetical protein
MKVDDIGERTNDRQRSALFVFREVMKEIQTRPISLTLDSPASHGCVCMCRTITHRRRLITEKLTVSGLNRFFTGILLLDVVRKLRDRIRPVPGDLKRN